ncbi:MAG: hypothetical protein GY807_05400 [Gammaproteobacteria bacterium]|nr:hypothetical protein [Gammaproteobacteria bacterium]
MNCSNDDAMEAEHEGACPHCGAVENYTEADDVWKCYDCQKEFDEPVSEGIPMSMVLTAESREVCPHCQSDNIEEGVEPEVTV